MENVAFREIPYFVPIFTHVLMYPSRKIRVDKYRGRVVGTRIRMFWSDPDLCAPKKVGSGSGLKIHMHKLSEYGLFLGKPQKKFFYNGPATKALPPPPPQAY